MLPSPSKIRKYMDTKCTSSYQQVYNLCTTNFSNGLTLHVRICIHDTIFPQSLFFFLAVYNANFHSFDMASPHQVTVQAGQPTAIDCGSFTNIPATSLNWEVRFGSVFEPISIDNERAVIGMNQSLYLLEPRVSDTGTLFRCILRNDILTEVDIGFVQVTVVEGRYLQKLICRDDLCIMVAKKVHFFSFQNLLLLLHMWLSNHKMLPRGQEKLCPLNAFLEERKYGEPWLYIEIYHEAQVFNVITIPSRGVIGRTVTWTAPEGVTNFRSSGFRLSISAITGANAGTYTCNVEGIGQFSATLNLLREYMEIYALELQNYIYISDPPMLETALPTDPISLVYGASLSLTCASSRGTSWEWYQNGIRCECTMHAYV